MTNGTESGPGDKPVPTRRNLPLGASAAATPPPPGCAPFRYPADPPQFAAWYGFIVFAIEQPALRQAFSELTGRRFLPPPRSGLDALIDAATGARDREAETIFAFIEWLNAAHWGEDLVAWQPLPAAEVADV